jgi:hypothetical protein
LILRMGYIMTEVGHSPRDPPRVSKWKTVSLFPILKNLFKTGFRNRKPIVLKN